MNFTKSLIAASLYLSSLAAAQTTPEFFLRSISTHVEYNNILFGAVGSIDGILVGGLQPQQTLPVGGSITSGVLSFLDMDPSDPIPAYFIHGAAGTQIQLDVWGTPQSGYSLDSHSILQVSGGKFYACTTSATGSSQIGVFYTTTAKHVPSGCFAIDLEAVYCTGITTCA